MRSHRAAPILCVGDRPIRPDHAAGDLRFMEIMKRLGRDGRPLTYAAHHGCPDVEDVRQRFTAYGLPRIDLPPAGGRLPQRTLARQAYALAFIEFWHVAEIWIPLIRRHQPWMPVIIDSVDVHFARESAAAQLSGVEASGIAERKHRELEAYRSADAIVAASSDDARLLRSEGIEVPIIEIPIIVYPGGTRAPSNGQRLLFVGGFNHRPNIDGLFWFVEQCWPAVREACPTATLAVVGSNPPPEILKLSDRPGIEMIGYVPEVEPQMEASDVSIAPLRFGAGMKGKVCQALAAAMPLVTTSIGIQGLPITDGRGARVADDADGFAQSVIWALRHPAAAAEMGKTGQRLLDDICGPVVADRRVGEVNHLVASATSPTAGQLTSWRAWSTFELTYSSLRRAARTALKGRRGSEGAVAKPV